jgi:hypothetical protein
VPTEPDAYPRTDQGPQNPSLPPPPVSPTNQVPLPNAEELPADNRINVTVNLPQKHWIVEWLPIGTNAALAVIGVFAICIYGGQLGAMRDSNQINREALTSVQRAFVNMGKNMQENAIIIPGQTAIQTWEFRPRLENSGVTPTRNAQNHANWIPWKGPLPDKFPFSDMGTQSTQNTRFILGPKEAATGANLEVPFSYIKSVKDDTEQLYFYGWVSYQDIFPKTAEHISMYCIELTDVRGELKPGTPYTFLWALCPTHNCADDECIGQPYGTPNRIWPN